MISTRSRGEIMNSINANVVVLVIGVGLLLASLFADIIGLGDDPGFGRQQTTGTIVGVAMVAISVYLMARKKDEPD